MKQIPEKYTQWDMDWVVASADGPREMVEMTTEKIVWSGKTSSYHHKWHDTPNPPDVKSGLRKVWFLDAQWTDCPIEVEQQVKDLWQGHDLGNDHYMLKRSLDDLEETEESGYQVDRWDDEAKTYTKVPLKTDAIRQWILEKVPDIPKDEDVIIHWWW